MPDLIFADRERNLLLHRSSTPTPQFVEFLQGIVWGSGGLLYTMPKVAESLQRLQNPHFFSLRVNGELVAVTTINHKTTTLHGQTYPACYSYGLAVHPGKRGLGYGTLMAEHRLRYGLGLIGQKGLFYGYIEASNTNSLKTIARVGSKSIGLYHALFISRLFPGRNLRFLIFGNIYVKQGREAAVFVLMEALLARCQMHFAMIYMDKRSPVYRSLAAAGKFGLFHACIDVPVHVMGYFTGFSASEMADIHRQPLFVSMNDPV